METERTVLTRIAMEDLDGLASLEADAEVVRHTRVAVPQTRDRVQERLARQVPRNNGLVTPFGIWTARLKDGGSGDIGDYLGWFMLMHTEWEGPELGYMIRRDYWGRGLASEVTKALIDATPAAVRHVYAVTGTTNAPSMRVLEKLGFERQGTHLDGSVLFVWSR